MTETADVANVPHTWRIGVVVERRDSANPWSDETWRTTEVMVAAPEDDVWKVLEEGEGWSRYYAGSLTVELFKRETEDYKMNLSQPMPAIYIVLRPGNDEDAGDVVPFLATFSPYEAECYLESGEMIVDGVPAPLSLMAWAVAYVETFHVDEPFKKRKQKRVDDSATGRAHGRELGRQPGRGER